MERSSFTGRGKELEKAERVSIDCKVPISSSTTELRGQIVPSQELDLESSRTRGNAELKGNPHMQISAGK